MMKCIFFGGPIHGEERIVDNFCHEYRVAVLPPPVLKKHDDSPGKNEAGFDIVIYLRNHPGSTIFCHTV